MRGGPNRAGLGPPSPPKLTSGAADASTTVGPVAGRRVPVLTFHVPDGGSNPSRLRAVAQLVEQHPGPLSRPQHLRKQRSCRPGRRDPVLVSNGSNPPGVSRRRGPGPHRSPGLHPSKFGTAGDVICTTVAVVAGRRVPVLLIERPRVRVPPTSVVAQLVEHSNPAPAGLRGQHLARNTTSISAGRADAVRSSLHRLPGRRESANGHPRGCVVAHGPHPSSGPQLIAKGSE